MSQGTQNDNVWSKSTDLVNFWRIVFGVSHVWFCLPEAVYRLYLDLNILDRRFFRMTILEMVLFVRLIFIFMDSFNFGTPIE